MTYEEIKKDAEQLLKMYGKNLKIEPKEGYYSCTFECGIGSFNFLVDKEHLHKPFALCFATEDLSERHAATSKAIEALQEL